MFSNLTRLTFKTTIKEALALANPRVGIVMGSDSDLPVMKDTTEVLEQLDIE